jgi:SH3 domain protein
MRKAALFVLLALMWQPGQAAAETAWIDDELFVPLRSGAGSQYRIVHRGLKTGTRLELLEWPEDGDWARVQYGDTEGWIGKQYVSRSPTAQIRLDQLQERFATVSAELEEVRATLQTVRQERNELAQAKSQLESTVTEQKDTVEHLQEVAADPIRLDKANRELNEKLSLMRTELDQLQAENNMLRSESTSRKWAMGAGILILGGIFGWLFKSRGGKRSGNWV